jgi:hypothetical protein
VSKPETTAFRSVSRRDRWPGLRRALTLAVSKDRFSDLDWNDFLQLGCKRLDRLPNLAN